MYTGPENRARHNCVRELAAPLGFSDLELFSVTADLTRARCRHRRGNRARRRTRRLFAQVNVSDQRTRSAGVAIAPPLLRI